MDTKNEILLLLTDKWCDWEASYVIAVANSFSDYTVEWYDNFKNGAIR